MFKILYQFLGVYSMGQIDSFLVFLSRKCQGSLEEGYIFYFKRGFFGDCYIGVEYYVLYIGRFCEVKK